MADKNDVWKKYKESILSKISASEIYDSIKNQKEGTDGWVTGLCPFHNDTRNSFAYNRDTLACVCFSPTCGKGSVFDFLMLTSGRNFKLASQGYYLHYPTKCQNGFTMKTRERQSHYLYYPAKGKKGFTVTRASNSFFHGELTMGKSKVMTIHTIHTYR